VEFVCGDVRRQCLPVGAAWQLHRLLRTCRCCHIPGQQHNMFIRGCRIHDGRLTRPISCAQAGTAVDMALLLYGTLCHMLSNDDALAMFAAAAASLAPHGIFVVEMTHPDDLLNGMLELSSEWEVSKN
jgi:hypothetical protein